MLGWLIEIRNFFLALSLGWLGVTFAAPSSDTEETAEPPEVSTQDKTRAAEVSPHNC